MVELEWGLNVAHNSMVELEWGLNIARNSMVEMEGLRPWRCPKLYGGAGGTEVLTLPKTLWWNWRDWSLNVAHNSMMELEWNLNVARK